MSKTATILVVDDVPDTIEILSRQLKKEGYKVLEATNGKDAIDAVRREKPDLVLMDCMMPEMDGFEATAVIKRESKAVFVPVIIVTATRNDTEGILKGFESGADDYICLPCEREEILVRVRAVLRIKGLHDELVRKNIELREAQEKLAQIAGPLSIVIENAGRLARRIKGAEGPNAFSEADFEDLARRLETIYESGLRCEEIIGRLHVKPGNA